ncbi:copper amine oxidase N-terminal domain-containing protein [Paenibacillus doosanensis]|uniref:copper amine oxidase N-terminal domain-containing protein n=1 Tax=Paenibacillus doosanensis TaxID=1229154 RepID=UPI00217F7F6E|nr:copper amine oxidase N-terminal domain-containing protein [Paenibacillus doosanensis]MCS7462540.1 copper amine oxidase N-terminal domain-containing protein [Paenibacillus doosanensis]
MKKYLIGMMIGAIITTAAPSYAEIGGKVEAIFSDIKVNINGFDTDLSDPLLIINGNSYVPLKEVATQMNYRVKYHESERTIELRNNLDVYYLGNQYYYSVKEINEKKDTPTLSLVTWGINHNVLYNGEKYIFDPILDYYYDNYTHEKYISDQVLARLAAPKINLESLKKYKVNREDNNIYEVEVTSKNIKLSVPTEEMD